jgi:RecF/RecN/SMC N terminal domain
MPSKLTAADTYADLFAAVADQRRRIAFFEPVVFHAHTIDSHDWAQRSNADPGRNDRKRLNTNAGVDEFLDELAANYRVVCVTDHMRSEYACRLAKAALARDDITVLPGVEISCEAPPSFGDCIHLLAVFHPDVDVGVIERVFAGQEDLPGPTQRTGHETVRFSDLRELRNRIHSEGDGLFILAHVENPKRGHRARFISDRKRTLRTMVDGKDDLKTDLSSEYAVYLANLQPDAVELKTVADQPHYAAFTKDGKLTNVACVAPADHHSFEDYEQPDTATFLKIPTADFSAVRDALRFHETRVRLPGQITTNATPHLVGLRLASASGNGLFLDTTVAFSPNLTCLIGPRGSGKSTVIEGLRYVLGRNPDLAKRTLEEAPSFANLAQGIQTANLRDTRLELLYQHSDGTQVALVATYDEDEDRRTRVFSVTGDDLKVPPDVVSNDYAVSIFSWSEMEVLGRQAALQRELVDRLLPEVGQLIERREAVIQQLASNRERIAQTVRELDAAGKADAGILGRYTQYRDAFTAINTAEVAALFERLDASRVRSELLASVDEELAALEEGIDPLTETDIHDRIGARLRDANPSAQAWWENNAKEKLDLISLEAMVRSSASASMNEVRGRRALIAELQATASADLERVELELRTKANLDKEQELKVDQRELARERFEAANSARERYLVLLQALDAEIDQRDQLAGELASAQDDISECRANELTTLNARLHELGGDRLEISVDRGHLKDRDCVVEFLNDQVLTQERAGRYLHRRIADRLCQMGRPTALSKALVTGAIDALGPDVPVGEGDALTADEAAKLIEGCRWRRGDEGVNADVIDDTVMPLLELAEQRIDDAVSIRLNGRAVDELSPGQRSSAMLPLIALAETGPLIIDQPEDNLDNAMVGNTLTRILAELKEQRQIIVSTHNPNIVVGGDAEQVVVLEAHDRHRAVLAKTGSIDDKAIIDAVLNVMEGGREAFETRSRRYGVGGLRSG